MFDRVFYLDVLITKVSFLVEASPDFSPGVFTTVGH